MQFTFRAFSMRTLQLTRMSRRGRHLALFIILFLVVLTLAGPVHAQAQLNIDGFYNQLQKTSQWWDQLWRSTFLGLGAPTTNSVSQVFPVFMQFVRIIAACVVTIYIVTMFSIIGRDGLAAFQFMIRGSLVIVLISYLFLGDGSNFGSIAYGGKILFNRVTAAMMKANINGVSITNALTDQIVSSKSKHYLEQEIKVCDAMPNPGVTLPDAFSDTFPLNEKDPQLNPDQQAAVRRLNCYYQVKGIADQLREQAASQQCFGIPGVNYACASTERFLSGFVHDMTYTYQAEFQKLKQHKLPNADNLLPLYNIRNYILGNVGIAFFQGLMYGLQYFFANLQELILFLWALTAPVMAAYSIFPFSNTGSLVTWGVTYLSVILSQVYYLIIIGLFASLLQSAQTTMLGDIVFPFVLGLGAWVIAASLATGGAIMAVRSLTNAGITTISTVGSLGAMATGGPIVAGAVRSGASAASSGAGTLARSGGSSSRVA